MRFRSGGRCGINSTNLKIFGCFSLFYFNYHVGSQIWNVYKPIIVLESSSYVNH